MTLVTSQLHLPPVAPPAVSNVSGNATAAAQANGGVVAQAAIGDAREAG